MRWYPVSCKPRYFENKEGPPILPEDHQLVQKLSDLARIRNWPGILECFNEEDTADTIKYADTGTINATRFPTEETPHVKFFSVFHEVVENKAPKNVIEKFLEFGASKTLVTSDGETPYDIAKRVGSDDEILSLLLFSDEFPESNDDIKKMEATLYSLMRSRVSELLDKYQVHEPQLCVLYEFNESFHLEVPRWLGGFNVEKHEKGIQVDSFCRVAGGSEQLHVISRTGELEFIAEGDAVFELKYPRQSELMSDDS